MMKAKWPNLVISFLNLFVGAEGDICSENTFPPLVPCCQLSAPPVRVSQTVDMRIIGNIESSDFLQASLTLH